MDLWFIGNACEDHLITADTSILEDKRTQWKKIDALPCNILRQSIDSKTPISGPIKLATLFGIR